MKRFLIIILLICLLAISTTSYGDMTKDETVYVNLNHDGSVSNISVVNRLSGTSTEEYFVDYGKYEYIKNLSGNEKPIVEEDKVKWPTSLLKGNNIYYEGSIEKELPINIKIKYFLNDTEVRGDKLAGKDGNVKIQFILGENEEGLTTQIQLPLDLDIFSDIRVKDGVTSIVGKKMNVVFTHLPMNEQVYEVEAYGRNIELDSILISSMPSSFTLPKDIDGKLDEFADGMDEMSKAANKLEDGSLKLAEGTSSMKKGFSGLSQGTSKITSGFKSIVSKFKEVVSGFETFNTGLIKFKEESILLSEGINNLNSGLSNLSNESSNIRNGIENLNNGLIQLNEGAKNLNDGLENLNENHQKMVSLAEELANSSDPRVKALAKGVILEAGALEELSSGANQVCLGTSDLAIGSKELYLGYNKYYEGKQTVSNGMNKLNEEVKNLPIELNKMYEGHSQLVEGLKKIYVGMEDLSNGLEEIDSNTANIPNEIDKLVDGQVELSKGISKLNVEGITKAKESINSFEGLDNFEGKSNFTSFVNNEKNKNSTTQFLMKTPEIKVKVEKVEKPETHKPKETLFQRIINLFKK